MVLTKGNSLITTLTLICCKNLDIDFVTPSSISVIRTKSKLKLFLKN